ncbi:hypothetical protein [Deinococcus aquatilis]|uniref:hypothetical protein n=1 Tax=Deinococcus aquatilis TaxID=519440 RepID=UPI00035C26AE|nr:hypothetical protein [Deinococcus aquatilis]
MPIQIWQVAREMTFKTKSAQKWQEVKLGIPTPNSNFFRVALMLILLELLKDLKD